ncbi:hypothetical protein HDU67_006970 [Dinochytrium kinnereticum]|nr:hypothetical protein HDU67_006970 [Dinochytrium kinnereticum]
MLDARHQDSLHASASKRKRHVSTKHSKFPITLNAGTGQVSVDEMVACDASMSPEELRQTLKSQGYLLLRNLLDREKVMAARHVVLQDMTKNGFIEPGTTAKIRMPEGDKLPCLLDRQDLAKHPKISSLLEDQSLFRIVTMIFGLPDTCENQQRKRRRKLPSKKLASTSQSPEVTGMPDSTERKESSEQSSENGPSKVFTLPFKWLRAVPTNLFTGPHLDRVYLGAGSQRLLTVWMPLGDSPAELGTLVVCPGSNTDPDFERLRREYGAHPAGKDGTKSGWITEDPAEIGKLYGIEKQVRWVAADLQAGDVLILGLDVLHMSSNNTTDSWRVAKALIGVFSIAFVPRRFTRSAVDGSENRFDVVRRARDNR